MPAVRLRLEDTSFACTTLKCCVFSNTTGLMTRDCHDNPKIYIQLRVLVARIKYYPSNTAVRLRDKPLQVYRIYITATPVVREMKL